MNIIRSSNKELFDKASQLTRQSLRKGKSLDVSIYATLFYFQNSQNASTLDMTSLQSWLQKNIEAPFAEQLQQAKNKADSSPGNTMDPSEKSPKSQPSKVPKYSKWLHWVNLGSLTLPWAVVIASIILSLAIFFGAKAIGDQITESLLKSFRNKEYAYVH